MRPPRAPAALRIGFRSARTRQYSNTIKRITAGYLRRRRAAGRARTPGRRRTVGTSRRASCASMASTSAASATPRAARSTTARWRRPCAAPSMTRMAFDVALPCGSTQTPSLKASGSQPGPRSATACAGYGRTVTRRRLSSGGRYVQAACNACGQAPCGSADAQRQLCTGRGGAQQARWAYAWLCCDARSQTRVLKNVRDLLEGVACRRRRHGSSWVVTHTPLFQACEPRCRPCSCRARLCNAVAGSCCRRPPVLLRIRGCGEDASPLPSVYDCAHRPRTRSRTRPAPCWRPGRSGAEAARRRRLSPQAWAPKPPHRDAQPATRT